MRLDTHSILPKMLRGFRNNQVPFTVHILVKREMEVNALNDVEDETK